MSSTQTDLTRRGLMAAGAGIAIGGGPAEAQTSEIVDIHAHVISPDMKRYPPSPFGGVQSDWSKQRPESFEELIAQMDEAGVAKAAIVQSSTIYGVNNDYVADCLAKDHKRFTGVCSIDTLAPDNVAVLQALMKRGMTGLRIFTGRDAKTAILVDPRAFPVWEFAQTANLPIVLEAGPPAWGNVEFLLKRYPKVTVILDHGGQPVLAEGPPFAKSRALFELAAYPNLNLKITPPLFAWTREGKSTPDEFFSRLTPIYGANRMAFGSNIPSEPPPMSKIIADAKLSLRSLSAKDLAMVMGGTAKRLYPALA